MFPMSLVGEDRNNAIKVINRGIDSRLTAFTKSQFVDTGYRLNCNLHIEEMEIFIRRLLDLENDDADLLADDIVCLQYGIDVI